MQATDWAPEHSQALRDLHAKGLSYAKIAQELNERFGTRYTRNAALSRGKRIGLLTPKIAQERPPRSCLRAATPPAQPCRGGQPGLPRPKKPAAKRAPVRLRCVGISPRLLTFDELEPGDCRYPYGGDKDGEPISFCGHPRCEGSSYCAPHFHLTRNPEEFLERPAGPVRLRLIAAA